MNTLIASILIVSKNNDKTIVRSINSALNQKLSETANMTFEVLVVDDVSHSKQIALLKDLESKKIKNLHIFFSKKPLGLAKARNYLIAKAKGTYLFFLDGDAYAHPQWIHNSVEMFKDTNVKAVASCVYFEKRKDLVNGLGGFLNKSFYGFDRYFGTYSYFLPTEPFYTLYGMGAGLILESDIVHKLHGFDQELFSWSYDDVDICLRIQLLGYAVIANPKSIIYHDTTSIINSSVARKYEDIRGKLYMFIIYSPMNALLQYIKAEVRVFLEADIQYRVLYMKALLQVLSRLDLLLKRRKEVNNFAVSAIRKSLYNSFKPFLYSIGINFRNNLYGLSKQAIFSDSFRLYENTTYDINRNVFVCNANSKFRLFNDGQKTLQFEVIAPFDFSVLTICIAQSDILKMRIRNTLEQNKTRMFLLPLEQNINKGYVDIYVHSTQTIHISTIKLV
ncbi:MAG TPA: glycosyltransferase [Candidatus Woesebacteria bacterium]|nr:glycosyltransferase [Candidatus Woesebacteria bacterium]